MAGPKHTYHWAPGDTGGAPKWLFAVVVGLISTMAFCIVLIF
jgi:hypothetical protein